MRLRTHVVFFALACSCSDPTTDSVAVTLPDGGRVPGVSCGDETVSSVAGTWDIIGSWAGEGQSTALLTIDQNSFSFAMAGKSADFTVSGATMTLVWKGGSGPIPISVTHVGAAVATGMLPLSVGGQWMFTNTSVSDSEDCTASLGTDAFSATCNDVHSTSLKMLDGSIVGQRQRQLTSLFGELGGVWHFTGSGGGSLDATVSGNTFTAVFDGGDNPSGDAGGWVTVKVCNGAASGKSSDGFEFAGTRR